VQGRDQYPRTALASVIGPDFVDYCVHVKNAEIERFQAEVSDREQPRIFRDVDFDHRGNAT